MSEEQLTMGETMRALKKLGLGQSISNAFRDANPVALRRWYVETFALDPYNGPLLRDLGSNQVLNALAEKRAWVTVEHAAIGNRLLFAMNPDMIPGPNLLDADTWRNESDVTNTLMRLFSPWDTIRYDPVGENWYQAVAPGQWKRHGKGAPGQNMAEGWIARWLEAMDPQLHPDVYTDWVPSATGWEPAEYQAKFAGCLTAFRKYRQANRTLANVRAVLERSEIMYLDTNTLNMIRTMAPFANGALAIVRSEYVDTAGNRHVILPGELLPLDTEYMVTNANTLTWSDPDKRIPAAANDPLTTEGDFIRLAEVEDMLLLNSCPTYWSFLTHAFPDPDERSAFLRLLGAAMYGTNLKIVAAMIGEPNAGKDTVINWLTYLMPGQVATLPFSAFTPYGDDDRGFAPLIGARVATVSGEVGEGRGSKLLAEKIKTVSSGGGKIRVAEKYEKPTDIWFDGMLFLQGNSIPTIAGGDRALYTNRLVAVEFKHPFPLVSRSFEDHYRREAPWFAQVLFLNYIQYLYEGGGMAGIAPPEAWRSFAKEFADSSNPHGFIEACIVPGDKPIPTQQFHQALSAMVARFGSPHPVGPNYWPKRLRALGFQMKGPHSIRRQTGQDRQLCYMLRVDASLSDGAFTQEQWNAVLKDASVTT